MNVAKLSLIAHHSRNIRRSILETSLMNAASVGKPLARGAGSCGIREFIQERSPLSAVCAGKFSVQNHQSFNISGVMPNRE
jgi:hypothetical protein